MGDDAELLRAWRAGDATAGAALYDRTFPLVNRFFRCKVDDEIAVDLIQATFLAAVESLERFRGASSFRAFLLGIARHELLDHYRSKARDRSVPIDELTLEDLDPSPSSLLRHGREQRALPAGHAAVERPRARVVGEGGELPREERARPLVARVLAS